MTLHQHKTAICLAHLNDKTDALKQLLFIATKPFQDESWRKALLNTNNQTIWRLIRPDSLGQLGISDDWVDWESAQQTQLMEHLAQCRNTSDMLEFHSALDSEISLV